MPAPKTKSENKSKPEVVKPTKVLSPKKQLEADHLAGKHLTDNVEGCAYCTRRTARAFKKEAATKRYFASQKR